jgi:rifampin ADP-ribosylating transferase
MLNKCEKSLLKLEEGKWQWSLMRENIQAINTALVLIDDARGAMPGAEAALSGAETALPGAEAITHDALYQASGALFSTLQKVEKALADLADGSSQQTLAVRRVAALRLTLTLIAERLAPTDDPGPFYHGTKADLGIGAELKPGFGSNYGTGETANYIYFAAAQEAAIWGAELAAGDGRGHVYIVEPIGAFEDDPNLTDVRYPGNPTRSYRTREPLRIVGEIDDWKGHPPEVLQTMLDGLEELKRQGIEAIN